MTDSDLCYMTASEALARSVIDARSSLLSRLDLEQLA